MSSSYRGFTLIEAILAIGLFSLVFLGLYAAFFSGLRIIDSSQSRILATAIANEKLEEIRNLRYEDVGVEGSYPTGTLPASEVVTRQGTDFTVDYRVDYFDDPKDGQAPDDTCPNDYKKVLVNVSWSGNWAGSVSGDTIVAPRNSTQECNERGGLLEVSVFDAQGKMVESPTIEVKNIETGVLKTAQPPNGVYSFVLPEGVGVYKLRAFKEFYSSQETFGAGDLYNGQVIAIPEHPNATVLEAQLTERSLSIDKQSSFLVETLESRIEGNIYYVREVGNDVNDGLSPNSAFRTIQKAVSTTQPGDMVFVGAGVYQEDVVVGGSGTQNNKIIFVADNNGSFTGDSGVVEIRCNKFCFDIDGSDFLEIHGFSLTGATSSAIKIHSGASNVKIEDNLIRTTGGVGISIENSTNITVSFNKVYSNETGLSLSGVSQTDIERNEIYNNATGTIVVNSSGLTFGFNKVYSNNQVALSFENSSQNTIKSNLIYNNGGMAIRFSNNSRNNTVVNNTLYQNQGQGILIEQNSDSNTLTNNIIASSTLAGIQVINSSNTQHSYNDLWQNNPDYEGLNSPTSSLSVDPLFVDPLNDNFYLSQKAAGQAQDSPLVNAGSNTAAALGLDNRTTRSDGVSDTGVVDIGFHYSVLNSLAYKSPQPFGEPVPNTTCSIRGNKIVGKDENEENIYKYSTIFQSSATGTVLLDGLEWDDYYFSSSCEASGIILEVLISWPSFNPVNLLPGVQQEVKLGLKTVDTLLVNVKNSQNGEPVFSASVRLYHQGLGYDQTLVSDKDGQVYFVPLQPASNYILEVEAAGFESASSTVNVTGHSQKTIELNPL